MKKDISVRKNYVFNLSYQIFAILLPIVTTPYLSRVLGSANIGIFNYCISIVTYFIMFGNLGLNLYGQREIAYYQNDSKKFSKIFFEIMILKFCTMSISLILFYFINVYGNHEYSFYYRILMLELFSNLIDVTWFFQGLEEFKKILIRNFFIRLLSIIFIFIFVKNYNDLFLYFVSYCLSNFLGNFSLLFYLSKYLTKVDFKSLRIMKHLKSTLILFIPQIAIQIYTVLDKTMLGKIIFDKAEVGFYSQGEKVVKLLLTIITSLGTVMLPRIAFNYSIGNNEKIKQYIYKSFNFVFFLGFPLIFGTFAIVDNFVPIFFGNGYDRVKLVMITICPILVIIGLSNVIGNQYLLPTKHQKEYTFSVICGALVNFLFNIVLIKMYGAIGASIGTVMAEFTVTFMQFYFVRKTFSLKRVINICYQYLVASIIMFCVLLIINQFYFSNYIMLIIKVFSGIIIYFSVLIVLKNDFVIENLNNIISKFKKNLFKGK